MPKYHSIESCFPAYLGCQKQSLAHPSGSWQPWFWRDNSQGAADSWGPGGVCGCQDMRRGVPKTLITNINHLLLKTGACQLKAFTSSKATNAPQVKPPIYLQHFVRAGLNSRGHVARVISHLFHLCKVVDRIPVQDQLSHRDERVVVMRPNL